MKAQVSALNHAVLEANQKLITKDPIVSNEGLNELIILNSQGEDVSSAINNIVKIKSIKNTKALRFRNCLTSSANMGMNNYSTLVNALKTEIESTNPIIKAMAVKQAGNIANLMNIKEIVPIIKRAAESPDPYVRKATALSILKIHHANPKFIDQYEMGKTLSNLIKDSNLNVVANALSTLVEINAGRTKPVFIPDFNTVINFLSSILDANEWGRIQILSYIETYEPTNPSEANEIVSRLKNPISSANSAISVSIIRCLIKMCSFADSTNQLSDILKHIIPPLMSMVHFDPEIQYIALKSLVILLNKLPGCLTTDVNVFFLKYTDPIYIKLEKLNVMYLLCNSNNAITIVKEFANYSKSSEESIIRNSISYIGKIALLFENVSELCANCIEGLILSKNVYAIQECIPACASLFRKYQDQFTSLIPTICQCISGTLNDPKAKSAMAWIIGEYGASISNTPELIEALFLENFINEPVEVQLSILTAVVKFCLNNPQLSEAKSIAEAILSLAINESDNPDLKDRGNFYFLAINDLGEKFQHIVSKASTAHINCDQKTIVGNKVNLLFSKLGSIATLYQQYPSEFVKSSPLYDPEVKSKPIPKPLDKVTEDDFLIFDVATPNNGNQNGQKQLPSYPILLESGENSISTEVRGIIDRDPENEKRFLSLCILNNGSEPQEINYIAIKRNIFRIIADSDLAYPIIYPQTFEIVQVPLSVEEASDPEADINDGLYVAIVTTNDERLIFSVSVSLECILMPEKYGRIPKSKFYEMNENIVNENIKSQNIKQSRFDLSTDFKKVFSSHGLHLLAKQGDNGVCFSAKTVADESLLVFIYFDQNRECLIQVKCYDQNVSLVICSLVAQFCQA